MTDTEPVRLLILDDSQNRAEELIVLLRTAGRATRAHQVESEENLIQMLKEKTWDLCVARPKASDITAERVVGLIRDMEKDIPLILLAEDNEHQTITDGLRMGAVDVALADDDDRLTFIISRELGHLANRRYRRKIEVALHETERRCQLLLDSSTAAVAYVTEGMHIYANEAYMELFGFQELEDLEGMPIIDLIAGEDQEKFKTFLKSFKDREENSEEFSCVHTEGDKIMTSMSMSPANYDDEPCTQVIIRALTDDAESANRIKEVSSQDLLTGLYNRQHFFEQLDSAIDQAITSSQTFVVFYIALDNFGKIKAETGIANADLVLADIAALLKSTVPEHALLARFGDEVFVLMIRGDGEDGSELGDNLCKAVAGHLSNFAGKTFQLAVSIGMTLLAESAPGSEEIISRCHRASVIEGGNACAFYRPEKDVTEGGEEKPAGEEQARLRYLLKDAIKKNRFKLLFQPIISLHGDDDEQFEVLLRLIDDDEKELRPPEFLEAAVKFGLAQKIDRWVILQSIKTLAEHRTGGSKARLFINVTHMSVTDDTFLPWVSVALKAARMPSDAIILQIHENDATTYLKETRNFTKKMAELHCKTSINHFGCSLNPFNMLKHLTVDYVKLDGSFSQEIESNEKRQKELIDMVKSLQSRGVLTAISGVENPVVLSTLWEAGVNFIQGNYLSGPLETLDYEFASEEM